MVASYNKSLGTSSVHHVAGEALAQWRASIRLKAKEAGAEVSPLPISLAIVFGMQRPKAHMRWSGGKLIPKMQYYYATPKVAPDLDKLVRAVMDALTGVCYADDAQVIEIWASKVYADVTKIGVIQLDYTAQQTLSPWMAADKTQDISTGQVSMSDLLRSQEEG